MEFKGNLMLKKKLSLLIGAALLWLFLCVAAGAPIVIERAGRRR